MKYLHKLRELLCEELEKIAEKGELSAGSLETAHKLTDTIKNIDKIEMLGEDGYSRAGYFDDRLYDQGSSNARRGEHWVRGHYSRDGEYDERRRDKMGRYSRDGAIDHLLAMMEDAARESKDEKERDAIRRCMKQLENA